MKWAIDARQDFSFSLPAELCNAVQTPYTVRNKRRKKETRNKKQETKNKKQNEVFN